MRVGTSGGSSTARCTTPAAISSAVVPRSLACAAARRSPRPSVQGPAPGAARHLPRHHPRPKTTQGGRPRRSKQRTHGLPVIVVWAAATCLQDVIAQLLTLLQG